MRRTLLLSAGLVLFVLAGDSSFSQQKKPWKPSPHIAPTEPRQPEAQRQVMTVPPGFELQLVAAEPDITMPINIAFDAKGRLWVTMSQEYPFPAKDPKKTRDTVKILEDFGPDGRARKITTFADNLNIPIGVLPYRNGAIIFSIPNVWFLEDTDGDGKADQRTILLSQFDQKDTHGLTGEFMLGFDGWVYACHGFANRSVVRARDGSSITMESGNVYRFLPDGTQIQHFTHGQVNPFGLAFDPLGNLFSVDCHTRPIYQLLRGGTYPHFGRQPPPIGFAPEMMTHIHGSTANAGITYYAADHFPPEFHDNIFTGNVITNRVNRDRLQRHGSTYRAIEMPDLVISKDPWFRPVDIKLGPDGAVYICDFYTRIIGHYEMPLDHPARTKEFGRIWRVIYKGKDGTGGAEKVRDWTKAGLDDLLAALAHPNLTVRLFATHQLVERGGDEVKAKLRQAATGTNEWQRAHALWALFRLSDLETKWLERAARDDSPLVRTHALKMKGAAWSGPPLPLAVAALKDKDAFVQRAAVEALAQHPWPDHIGPLLDLCRGVPKEDTHLLHAGRLALRHQLKSEGAWKKLEELKLSEADLRLLAGVVIDLPTEPAADFLLKHLPTIADNPGNLKRYSHHIARYGVRDAQAVLVRYALEHLQKRVDDQALLLRTIQQAAQERGIAPPPDVIALAREVSAQLLESTQPNQVQAGIELAGSLRLAKVAPRLEKLFTDQRRPEDLRRAAAGALLSIEPKRHIGVVSQRLHDTREPSGLREQLAGILGSSNLPEARVELVKALTPAPAKLQSAIAVALAGSRQGAEDLLAAVEAGKASPRLLREQPVEQKLQQANPPNLAEKMEKLTQGLPAVDVRVQHMIRDRAAIFYRLGGDPKQGQKVFEKNCAVCHQIANKGSKYAPQLDGIGLRGPERLLEDILDPSRNVDQAFRATVLEFKDGKVFSGLLLREEGKVLVLVDSQGKEQRHSRDDVERLFVSPRSPMPTGLDQQIRDQELYDLLAFLLQQPEKK